jgi:hypothetical protein
VNSRRARSQAASAARPARLICDNPEGRSGRKPSGPELPVTTASTAAWLDAAKQIIGLAGDDTISDAVTGPPTDLSVDRVNGGLGTDVCEGPELDGDILTGCP